MATTATEATETEVMATGALEAETGALVEAVADSEVVDTHPAATETIGTFNHFLLLNDRIMR